MFRRASQVMMGVAVNRKHHKNEDVRLKCPACFEGPKRDNVRCCRHQVALMVCHCYNLGGWRADQKRNQVTPTQDIDYAILRKVDIWLKSSGES